MPIVTASWIDETWDFLIPLHQIYDWKEIALHEMWITKIHMGINYNPDEYYGLCIDNGPSKE